ncbi:30S ribosomal protein S1 [Campylobacter sp. FMV-PI01]|uniref:30S ribosomal protein S1 n=1 Tax=Campylobacter portucalensis TaxID=2608384 RepID=A0A6L5WI04_9BACT|nr:30S ribosomal protein S1 [Campylobacter portucalensis]MSN96082.1 30S ribosomal protein S1 [Campylobacter portucalensis]
MAEVNEKVQKDQELEGMDFATILEEYSNEKEQKENGGIIKGKIMAISDDQVFVDVGKKIEGVLNIEEVKDENGNIIFKEGDDIEVLMTGSARGKPSLSFKQVKKMQKVAEFIENYNENDQNIIEVKIKSKNKGGYVCLNSDGVEFFMPKSQSALKDSNSFIGKTYKVKVFKVDSGSILVSRKKLLDEDRKAKRDIINQIVKNDDIIEGTIKKITTYGMFVDVGGVDGLVHYSEISYKGPVNPGSIYNEGDKVPVKVIKYDDKKHLSLSIKSAMPDPWDEILENGLEVGDVINVTVNNIEKYGAFVDLGNDIEGFLHISEISWDKNIKSPSDFIKEGQNIDVEIIEIDIKDRRLRVSLKKLLEKPFEIFLKKYKEGDVVTGKITSITDFGAFVRIGGIEGLLHNEDASWDRNSKCSNLFKKDTEIEVKIIKIDSQQEKVSLSHKELTDGPIALYVTDKKEGDIVKGKVKDKKDFGVFVELDSGVDALIKKEDCGNLDVESLNVGDEVEAAIDNIDVKRNKIRLSVKRLARQKERAVLNEINKENSDKLTIGDIIKEQLS